MTEERGMKLNRSRRPARHAVMTAEQYRALVQALIDRARSDLSIAERLAEELRQVHGGAAPTTEHRGGDR